MAFLCSKTMPKILVLPYQHRASDRNHTVYWELDIFGSVGTKSKSPTSYLIPPGSMNGFLKQRDAKLREGTPQLFQPAKQLK